MVNLLFYSENDDLCKSVIAILKSEGMFSLFTLISVDDPTVKIPAEIKTVPTIIIPSIKKILVATEILKWVKTTISNKNNMKSGRENERHEQCITSSPTSNNEKGCSGPLGFISSEMSGISDIYAYTNIDNIPRHTYVSCKDIDKNTIYTAPEKQMKLNTSTQANYIKYIEQKRKEQDTHINEHLNIKYSNPEIIKSKQAEIDKMINKIVQNQQAQLYNA